MSVIIETSIGDLEVDLFVDKAKNISRNFLKLCKIKHYNNVLFSQVQQNYLAQIQTENPTTIDHFISSSEPKYLPDEIDPSKKHNKIGLLSTNNLGQDKNNSEFFITLTDLHLAHFDEKHSIFGQVQVGIHILEKLNNEVIVDEENMPYINLRILHTIVIDDPFEDPEGLIEPDQSPKRIEVSDNNRLEYHEKERLMRESDKTEEEAIEEAKSQIAKVREIKLQMLGDIPDADMKPPDNVLFVCQLNAITQERDLEIIFSRFGVITRCEVVRDWKTGESLQYAFIEFETEKSCQEAYFKMKGALIDERRIHVDFSQSLQKFKNMRRNPNAGKKQFGGNRGTGFDKLEFSKFYRGERADNQQHRMVFEEMEEKEKEAEEKRREQRNRSNKERSISNGRNGQNDRSVSRERKLKRERERDRHSLSEEKGRKRQDRDHQKTRDKKEKKDTTDKKEKRSSRSNSSDRTHNNDRKHSNRDDNKYKQRKYEDSYKNDNKQSKKRYDNYQDDYDTSRKNRYSSREKSSHSKNQRDKYIEDNKKDRKQK